MYFLGEVLIRQTGPWAVTPDILTWWRSGANAMSGAEVVYMNTCQPAMDSSQRSRSPKFVDLYGYLRREAGFEGPADSSEKHFRILVVWLHLTQIGYFIGRIEFVCEVLLEPAPCERSAVKAALISYIQGVSDSYCFALTDRLQFFALTRSSLSHYFNSSDGQRMTWPKADATFVSVVVL
jgi:hypothetical protein